MEIKVKKALEKNDMILICPICMHKYNEDKNAPLVLRCGHTFCRNCGVNLLKFSQIMCPYDKQKFRCDKIDDLAKNIALLDLLEAERKKAPQQEEKKVNNQRFCEYHPTKKVKFYCN